MPKIIKDIDKTLQNCARELFMKYGYLNVDMKMISEKSEIAVGTIYHYYKNKQQLYLCVLGESWEETFLKLSEINSSGCTHNVKLCRLITTLYHDIKDRNGLGKVLLDNSVEELKTNSFFLELKRKLILSVCDILSSSDKNGGDFSGENTMDRMTEVLLVSIVALIDFHPDDDTGNIDFLKQLFSVSK